MGTSGSYGGSGGAAWSNARRAATALGSSPTAGNARRAAAAAAAALAGWEELPPTAEDPVPSEPAVPDGRVLPPPVGPSLSALPPLTSLGGSPRGRTRSGGRGTAAMGGRGVARIRTGSSRSPRRAAFAAARIAYAGYAAREGDAAALAAVGIDIADLAGHTARHQCNVILNAILDLPRTLQEQELRLACSTTLIELLNDEAGLPPNDVVRLFVSNYLVEIMAVELSASERESSDGLDAERILRQTVEAVVAREVARMGSQVTSLDFERVIAGTLERVRRILQTS